MSLVLLLIYTAFAFIFFPHIHNVLWVVIINLFSIFCIFFIPKLDEKYSSRFTKILHSFYFLPFFYLGYEQINLYIPLLNPLNYDSTFAKLDFMICHTNPTEWVYRFANPLLTEYLQISYNLFQPVILCVSLDYFFFQKDYEKFRHYTFVIMFGFYLSYLLYVFFPAIGPRFEVHNFLNTDKELPGLLFTQPLRDFINSANGVKQGMTDYFQHVNKDCMPSGHTMMSLVATYMCFRLNSRLKWLLLVSTVSIMFSTIYLRYHYLVDLLAGVICSWIVYFSYPVLMKFFKKNSIPI